MRPTTCPPSAAGELVAAAPPERAPPKPVIPAKAGISVHCAAAYQVVPRMVVMSRKFENSNFCAWNFHAAPPAKSPSSHADLYTSIALFHSAEVPFGAWNSHKSALMGSAPDSGVNQPRRLAAVAAGFHRAGMASVLGEIQAIVLFAVALVIARVRAFVRRH